MNIVETVLFQYQNCTCWYADLHKNINNRDFYVHQGISLKEYIGISIFFTYTMLFPPSYTTSFRYIIHYHVLHVPCNGSCVSRAGGGGGRIVWKKLKSYIFFQRNALMDIKISIIDICYANTARIPTNLMVSLHLYFINEKFNKTAKVEKLTKKVGRSVHLIIIGPSSSI